MRFRSDLEPPFYWAGAKLGELNFQTSRPFLLTVKSAGRAISCLFFKWTK